MKALDLQASTAHWNGDVSIVPAKGRREILKADLFDVSLKKMAAAPRNVSQPFLAFIIP